MAKKESRGRFLTKGALKLLSYVCVDGAAAGITAAVVPLTMINPIVGGIIVAGSTIVSMAVCDKVVDSYVEEQVDNFADKIDPLIESAKLINRSKEIFDKDGKESAAAYLKANGFDMKQVNEIIKGFEKKKQ